MSWREPFRPLQGLERLRFLDQNRRSCFSFASLIMWPWASLPSFRAPLGIVSPSSVRAHIFSTPQGLALFRLWTSPISTPHPSKSCLMTHFSCFIARPEPYSARCHLLRALQISNDLDSAYQTRFSVMGYLSVSQVPDLPPLTQHEHKTYSIPEKQH